MTNQRRDHRERGFNLGRNAPATPVNWYHSIELPDGRVTPGHQSLDRLRWRIAQFPIPADLTGKRVLDIGAWDGWFTFEMERRGATVVAADSTECPGFLEARRLLGSKAEYVIEDVCRLDPHRLGRFDIVLFLGVLYHLKHPLLALERVCELSTDLVCVESYVTDDGSESAATPRMEFYETTELRGQFDNWVGPNTACLTALCRTAGFARVELGAVADHRAHVTCHRRWPEPSGNDPAPYILCVENSVSLDHSFSAARDDYIGIWFEAAGTLDRDSIQPQVGAYGSRPVMVERTAEAGWHVVAKLPPGLDPDWHEVRLRTPASPWSNAVRIGVDAAAAPPPDASDLRIATVTDGVTWEPNLVRLSAGAWVSVWVAGLAEQAERGDVTVRLNGTDLPAAYLSVIDANGLRQINARLPYGLQPGSARITVASGPRESSSVELRLVASE